MKRNFSQVIQKVAAVLSRAISPGRVFLSILFVAGLWLLPAITQPQVTNTQPIRQAVQEAGGISIVSAIELAAPNCSRSCQIQVCTRWIPAGPGCSDPGPGGGCCTDYETQCDPDCAEPPTPIPPPSISASLNCSDWGSAGWCRGSLSVDLTASDLMPGSQVIISGTLDGDPFACTSGQTSCSIPVNTEGTGTLSYRVDSTTLLSSSGSINYQLDWTTPDIDGSFSAVAGANGWYVSDVDLNASASDDTSGLASFQISFDGSTYNTYADTTLSDGVYTVYLSATDRAGNNTQSVQTFQVDTITPSLSLATSGTMGSGGWYRSPVQVTASANDSGSGVAQIEVSRDGGAWTAVNGPVSFADGYHTHRFRVTDVAGNITTTPQVAFQVDATGPDVQLVSETELGETLYYEVQDDGSELSLLEFSIEDEDETFGKVKWQEDVSGNYYDGGVLWDGKFRDGQSAPIGTYYLTIRARDIAGNETRKTGVITVNLLSFMLDIPPFNPPEPPALVEEITETADTTGTSTTDFGGSVTLRDQTEFTKTEFLTQGTSSPMTTTAAGNILFGAAAAAAVGAFVAEAQRKREEEEAARREADRAAFLARIEKEDAKKGNRILSYKERAKAYQRSLDNYKASLIKNGFSEKEASALKTRAVLGGSIPSVASAVANRDRNNAMEEKMAREDAADEARWLAMKQAEEQRRKAEQEAAMAAYYQSERDSTITSPADDAPSGPATETDPYDYLKKLNPPSWLSISGDASLDHELFSDKFIGVTNVNRGIGEIMFYEEQNLKLSSSVTGTRNPGGVVDINVTNGDLTLSVGNYELFANPFNGTLGVTVKTVPDPRNPNRFTEDTYAHDWDFNWGLTKNSIVTTHSEVNINQQNSTDGFQVEERNTVEGEIHTIKTTSIMLTTSVAIVVVVAVGTWVAGLSAGGLILQGLQGAG